MNVGRVGSFIRDQRMGAKLSLRKVASLAGVSIPYLSQVERGLRKPSAEILQAIAKGLRISAETLYVQAGILDERPASDVATSIMADMSITESQKKALLQIYQAFREETGRAVDGQAVAPAKSTRSNSTEKSNRSNSTEKSTRSKSTAATTKSSARASRARSGRIAHGVPSRQAGGGTVSQAGSSPHPAPTRPPATNPTQEEVQ